MIVFPIPLHRVPPTCCIADCDHVAKDRVDSALDLIHHVPCSFKLPGPTLLRVAR
jgi:hypothetical protein